jgi:hypothetical protein
MALPAGVSVTKYREMMAHQPGSSERASMEVYVRGLGDRISWAQALVAKRLYGPLYCVPNNLALGTENYVDILNRQISQELTRAGQSGVPSSFVEQEYISVVLLRGLLDTFPCRAGKK